MAANIPPPPPKRALNDSSTARLLGNSITANIPPPPPKRQNVASDPRKTSQKRTLEEFEIATADDEPSPKKPKLHQIDPVPQPKPNAVLSWNHYAVIFWLNRVNDGKLAYIEYVNLRKHIFIGKIRGNELDKINEVILRMIGIYDEKHVKRILNAIEQLLENDNFDNIVAETIKTDDIPFAYLDPITYEIMQDPVTLTMSGNTHERLVIEAYINRFNKDPVSQKAARLSDIVENDRLKHKIDAWKKENFNLP